MTFSTSPLDTVFAPPAKFAAEKRIPPAADVLPGVVTPDPPVTSIFPVIVAEPMIENEVVVADFEPDADADQPTARRAAMTELVTSVTVGDA